MNTDEQNKKSVRLTVRAFQALAKPKSWNKNRWSLLFSVSLTVIDKTATDPLLYSKKKVTSNMNEERTSFLVSCLSEPTTS